jgi:quercetin dioxygenase-like cupin family protein
MPRVDFPAVPLPRDDTRRTLTPADPDDPGLTHVGVAGGTYTFLVTGKQTAGRYALIDMLIRAGGGPPPHRHDFEEMFHVLEGEFEVVVRDQSQLATVGQTVNVPALAPHRFRNVSSGEGRLLCLVSPSGLEEFFLGVGDLLPNRTASAPQLSEAELKERLARSASLNARYRIENL